MLIAPLVLCGYLWVLGGVSLENLLFLAGGLLVLDFFVAMLGIHCGIIYYRSRTAIATSLAPFVLPILRRCHLHAHYDLVSRVVQQTACTVPRNHRWMRYRFVLCIGIKEPIECDYNQPFLLRS